MVPVGSGSKVPSTGPETILLVPCTSTSSSDWVYAKKAPVEARVLGLALPRHRWFRAVNLDPV